LPLTCEICSCSGMLGDSCSVLLYHSGGGGHPWGSRSSYVRWCKNLRSSELYRVLAYLDDFLIVPSPAGVIANPGDCESAASKKGRLLEELGLTRHPAKGEWVGSTRVEHLVVVIDTEGEKFFIAPRKLRRLGRWQGSCRVNAERERDGCRQKVCGHLWAPAFP
jgi:hypothetical protein